MVTVLTEVYEILRKQFGDEDAKRLMDFFQQNLVRLATKDDVAQLEQKVMTELVGKADKVDLARIRELLEYKTDKEDAARIEAELRNKADKEDVAQLRAELQRKADKEDVARIEAELQRETDKEDIYRLQAEFNRRAFQETFARIEEKLRRMPDKEDFARLLKALERKADKEDVAQVREAVLRLEARMNLQFVVLLLAIIDQPQSLGVARSDIALHEVSGERKWLSSKPQNLNLLTKNWNGSRRWAKKFTSESDTK